MPQRQTGNSMEVNEVTTFLDNLSHPLKAEILFLRDCISTEFPSLKEIIKWNAPSYQHNGIDFLTFNLSKPKEIRLVFHRGAKAKDALQDNFIEDTGGLLKWAGKDRALATFISMEDIKGNQQELMTIIRLWMEKL